MDTLGDYYGERIEVRRDERTGRWSLFRCGGSVLIDKVEGLHLRDVDLVVVPSRARWSVREARRNNSAFCVRGTLISPSLEADDLGLVEAVFALRRARTWLLRESAAPLEHAPLAVLTPQGQVLVPKTFAAQLIYGGARGRRPSPASLASVGAQLEEIGASWCLSDRQPIRNREFLSRFDQDQPMYAVWPTGNPWEDRPKFFESLAGVRAFIGRRPGQPKLRLHAPTPGEVVSLPIDLPSFYADRVAEVGWMFHHGRQPLDWLENGHLVYVLVPRAERLADSWDAFTFEQAGELEEWLEHRA